MVHLKYLCFVLNSHLWNVPNFQLVQENLPNRSLLFQKSDWLDSYKNGRAETHIKEPVLIRIFWLKFHWLSPLRAPKRLKCGDGSYIMDFMLFGFKIHGSHMIRKWNKNPNSKCCQELSRALMLNTVSIHARHMQFLRALLRTLKAGI